MATRRVFLAAGCFSPLMLLADVSASDSRASSGAPAPAPAKASNGGAASITSLLVDDHDVLYRSGTRRLFHPLKRHPDNPLIAGRDKPWEVALAFNSVHRDPKTGTYQMWYQSYAGEAAKDKTRRCTVCYAESTDGLRWHKPDLDLFPFNDVARTNIVLVANGGYSDRYGAGVLFDARERDPARRYKMAYFDFSVDGGKQYPGLCVAFSPDGMHWTKCPRAPLLRAGYGDVGDELPFSDDRASSPWRCPLSVADAFEVIWDPVHEVYALYGKMWIDGPDGRMYWKHGAGRAVSRDFVNWDPPALCMWPDDLDAPYVEFHTTPVFFYHGVYFAAPQILNRGDRGGTMDVELAVSRDGVRFDRPFRSPFWLPKRDGNHFDSGTVVTNATPVVLDDEIRFYYGGYSQGATGADDMSHVSGIGLATMPRDRFAGVRPAETLGQVTLRPRDLSGCRQIRLNADASAGQVRLELLDATGRRVRGYSKDDAAPLRGDSLRHVAVWKGKRLADLPPGAYTPRLHLEGAAEVFAVTFEA
jgi:hypothetical protein